MAYIKYKGLKSGFNGENVVVSLEIGSNLLEFDGLRYSILTGLLSYADEFRGSQDPSESQSHFPPLLLSWEVVPEISIVDDGDSKDTLGGEESLPGSDC